MRLSEWRASSPSKEAGGAKVAAIVDPILDVLGAGPDPNCWVAWGEEPSVRYAIFAPTAAGLITCYVRVNVPGEGPRASAKLIRWNRVQLGELGMETQGAHRLLSFQVEQQILNGADETADRIATFALQLFAAIDGRPIPEAATARRKGRTAAAKTAGRTSAARRPQGSKAAATGSRGSAVALRPDRTAGGR
jgi:hypothetical protein